MLDKIKDPKIELKITSVSENEELCDVCGGYGWLHDEEKGFIEKCIHCYNGKVKLCPECRSPVRGMCGSKSCQDKRYLDLERSRKSKATILDIEDVPSESAIMLYSDSYSYNEGYFNDIDELIDHCEDVGEIVPDYVWSTREVRLTMDASDIVDSACEELHESARDYIANEDILQSFLDDWCKNQYGVSTYCVDYKYMIRVVESGVMDSLKALSNAANDSDMCD